MDMQFMRDIHTNTILLVISNSYTQSPRASQAHLSGIGMLTVLTAAHLALLSLLPLIERLLASTDSANGAASFTFNPDFTQAGAYNVAFVASDGSLADTEISI